MSQFNALERFLEEPSLRANIAVQRVESKREATWEDIPLQLHPNVIATLQESGIQKVYKHQAQAIKSLLQGHSTVITTGVASGKSLCYQSVILNSLAYNSNNTALCLFPTKALTQDQRKSFATILSDFSRITQQEYSLGIYDGDTAQGERQKIRNKVNILLTNPDMMHIGILPNHPSWSKFFKELKYIVVDEVHIYRGIFGSHFTNVLRRLKRICRHYGSNPTFVLTSATVGNTQEFISSLLESLFRTIQVDYSPQGNRHFLIYNPPIINEELGIRRSALKETSKIAKFFTKENFQSIVFSRSRRGVELILTNLQKRADAKVLAGYRSGYLKEERREIEHQLKSGSLNTVVATNALELGIDIGDLDVVIINGYPGSIASTKQQAGRAGRTGNDSLVIMITNSDLINQYLVRNPDYLFNNNPEQALLDPNNIQILLNHLKCALAELAFEEDEDFGIHNSKTVNDLLNWLINNKLAVKRAKKIIWNTQDRPARDISLRTISTSSFTLLHNGISIGTIDNSSAYWFAHPQAVYIHNGAPFYVKDFDIEKREIKLETHLEDYYTEPLRKTSFKIQKEIDSNQYAYGTSRFSILTVHTQVTGFKRLRWDSREILSYEELDQPETVLNTKGLVFTFTPEIEEFIESEGNSHKNNNYGKGWEATKRSVRERDHNTCQNCGKLGNSLNLDVHHIKPFKTFDSIAEANSLENLITLCKQCHNQAESSVKTQSTMAGLTYLMRNLLPFYLMCSEGDIQVVFTQDMVETDNRPTIVIYDTFTGGVGLSKKVTSSLTNLFRLCYQNIINCECEEGCPSCVGPIADNGEGSKESVIMLLKKLIREEECQN
jgi:DEAD/DEAH box helicase domain-containing protein